MKVFSKKLILSILFATLFANSVFGGQAGSKPNSTDQRGQKRKRASSEHDSNESTKKIKIVHNGVEFSEEIFFTEEKIANIQANVKTTLERIDNIQKISNIIEKYDSEPGLFTLNLDEVNKKVIFYEDEAFNQLLNDPKKGFKEKVLFWGLDLSDFNLEDVNLNNTVLINVSFSGNKSLIRTKFKNSITFGSNFDNTTIDNCNFTGSFLVDVSFNNSQITNSTFGRVALCRASFKSSFLSNNYFTNMNIIKNNPDFSNSTIQDSIFSQAYFDGASFNGATIQGIQRKMMFKKCFFENSNFEDLILENVFFDEPYIPVSEKYVKRITDEITQYEKVLLAGSFLYCPPLGFFGLIGLSTRGDYYEETVKNDLPNIGFYDIQRAPDCIFLNPEGFGKKEKDFLEGLGAEVIYKKDEDLINYKRTFEQGLYNGAGHAFGKSVIDGSAK